MKVESNLDINKKSFSNIFTPSTLVRKLPLYLIGSGYFYAEKQYFTTRSNCNNYLIIYTLSGEGELEYDNRKFAIKKDDVMIIDCMQLQSYKTAGSSGHWEFYYIHVGGEAMAGLYELLTVNSSYVYSILNSAHINEAINNVINFNSIETLTNALNVSELLLSLLNKLLLSKNIEQFKEDKKSLQIIDTALGYIHENLETNIKVEDISDKVHLSKFYFIKYFKLHTGITPYEYITLSRINNAKKLLKNTQLNASEICFKCGFNEENNFFKSFKKVVGCTPIEYKKQDM